MPALQIAQQIDDLGLYGNIQRGNRLVAHDKARVDDQSAGYADTLPLAAGKFMRIAPVMLFGEADLFQNLKHTFAALLRGTAPLNAQALRNNLPDSHTRV